MVFNKHTVNIQNCKQLIEDFIRFSSHFKMENAFVRMVDEISNLSVAAKHKEFDVNLRGKWNNYLNEMTSLDVMNVANVDVGCKFFFFGVWYHLMWRK